MDTTKSDAKLTYEHYVLIPADGRRHEIIAGEHYVNPAPNIYHQTVSKRLQFYLYSEIELKNRGLVFTAPLDLQLGPHDIVQPDLVVILNGGSTEITPAKVIGPPDLVIEILSPSTETNDRTLKRKLYEQAGVPEYWLLDPQEQVITQLTASGGAYSELPISKEEIQLHCCQDLSLKLDQIW